MNGLAVGLRIAASSFEAVSIAINRLPPIGVTGPRSTGFAQRRRRLVPGGISSTARPPRRYVRIFGRSILVLNGQARTAKRAGNLVCGFQGAPPSRTSGCALRGLSPWLRGGAAFTCTGVRTGSTDIAGGLLPLLTLQIVQVTLRQNHAASAPIANVSHFPSGNACARTRARAPARRACGPARACRETPDSRS